MADPYVSYPYPPPGPVREPGANGFATAALVLGIVAPCGGGLLSIIFGLSEYSPEAYADDSVVNYYYLPDSNSWETGDREVTCHTYYSEGPRTGSLQD